MGIVGNRQLTATVAPQNVTNKTMTYSIAPVASGLTVSPGGNIIQTDTAPAGKYMIAMRTEDGSCTDTYVLTLTESQEG